MKKLTTEEFIEKAKQIHGDEYDYSKTEYINKRTKVCIICPKHGEFWQEPNSHIKGCGCKKCADNNKKEKYSINTEEFIEKAKKVHGDKYDYSKVDYVNSHTKVCIICPEHGEFWQTPNDHIKGCGCKKCANERISKINSKIGNFTFIERAKEVHGDKYDYSKINYINPKTKILIYCKFHKEYFEMLPHNHLNGQGCPKCKNRKISESLQHNKCDFINASKKMHGNNRYDYSKVEYNGIFNKVCIICPIHGEFWQRPSDHKYGCGCPKCNESHLENDVRIILEENNIKYEYQKKFDWLGRQSLDFYLPDYNIAIECQGEQHFKPIPYFGGESSFKKIIERDKNKLLLCDNNGIKMIYYHINNISNFNDFIKSIK